MDNSILVTIITGMSLFATALVTTLLTRDRTKSEAAKYRAEAERELVEAAQIRLQMMRLMLEQIERDIDSKLERSQDIDSKQMN